MSNHPLTGLWSHASCFVECSESLRFTTLNHTTVFLTLVFNYVLKYGYLSLFVIIASHTFKYLSRPLPRTLQRSSVKKVPQRPNWRYVVFGSMRNWISQTLQMRQSYKENTRRVWKNDSGPQDRSYYSCGLHSSWQLSHSLVQKSRQGLLKNPCQCSVEKEQQRQNNSASMHLYVQA